MQFQNLPKVHSGRDSKRRQDNINRSAVRKIRHVFNRQDPRNNSLVAVSSRQLVADFYISNLRYFYMDSLYDARFQTISFFSGKNLDSDNSSALAVFHSLGCVLDVSGFLAEQRTEKPLFRRKLSLSFGSDFPDQNIAGPDFGADPDDTFFVKVPKFHFTDIGNVVSRNLRS